MTRADGRASFGSRERKRSLAPDLERNVADWTKANADHTDRSAAAAWAKEQITWGMFGVPELQRPHFGLGRTEWSGEDGVEHQLTHGDWIEDATHPYYDHVPAEWARRWPWEEIWVARKP